MQENQKHRIGVIGGGFGGLKTILELAKKKLPNVEITLISNKSFFEYYPALYRVVTGASPIEVCIPLPDILPDGVTLVIDTASNITLATKTVLTASGATYQFDTLVLALGSETTYFNLPGLSDLSFGFKSAKEAVRLKEHIFSLFSEHLAPAQSDMTSHYHVVIVGGGPSGVEVAGDLTVHMHKLAQFFKVDPSYITIDLIESNPRLLPTLPPDASAKILARLRKLGVNIFLNRQLTSEEVGQVYMKDMSMKAKTVIWTAGTQINQLYTKIEGLTFSPRKRVAVDDHLEVSGQAGVYVIGDGAQTEFTGLAQTALYDGAFVADDISRKLQNKTRTVYVAKKNAFAVPIGERWAVFIWGPIQLYGFSAYLIRHAIDFLFFAEFVDVRKLFGIFFQGWKYRKVSDKI